MPKPPLYIKSDSNTECGYCKSSVPGNAVICASCGASRTYLLRPQADRCGIFLLCLTISFTYFGYIYIPVASDWLLSQNPEVKIINTGLKYFMWFFWFLLGPLLTLARLFEFWERLRYPFDGEAWRRP